MQNNKLPLKHWLVQPAYLPVLEQVKPEPSRTELRMGLQPDTLQPTEYWR
jgi:hypothetical protein